MGGANRKSEDEPQDKPEERSRPKVVDKRISARAEEGAQRGPRERETRAEPSKPAGTPGEVTPGAETPGGTPAAVWTPEQEAEARRIAEEVARAPSRDWVVDAATGVANVARMKLSRGEPAEAALAIDALAGILDATGPRLGEAEPPLRQVLAQLRLAYAGISSRKAGPPE